MSTIRIRPNWADTGGPVSPTGEMYTANTTTTLRELMGELQAWFNLENVGPDSAFTLSVPGHITGWNISRPNLQTTDRLDPEMTVGNAFTQDGMTVLIITASVADAAKLCLVFEARWRTKRWTEAEWRWVDTRKTLSQVPRTYPTAPYTTESGTPVNYTAALGNYRRSPPRADTIVFEYVQYKE